MGSQGSVWYVDFFRADYLNVYGHMFTDERAEKESASIAKRPRRKIGSTRVTWPVKARRNGRMTTGTVVVH